MSTLNQDMQPTSDTYAKRWQLESDEAFEGEVESQLQYVFQDEVRGEWGKRFKVSDMDRISAVKRLCALATHSNSLTQIKRQRFVGSLGLFETLCNFMRTGSDMLQYWSGLLVLQLLYQNIACCTIFLNCKGISTIAEILARAEDTMIKLERGEHIFDDFTSLYDRTCSQHTLYVSFMIASNISNFFPESHEQIRLTQRPWSFRVQGKDNSGPPPPGIITVCVAMIRRGRTLEYPTLDAAIRLVLSMSKVTVNILPLMRADLTRAMAKHYEAETSEGPACKATAAHIQAFSALMVQKHVRGHHGRNLAVHSKSLRLAKFYSNFKQKTYFTAWKRFVQDNKRIKTFFKSMFDKREKYGVKGSFKRWNMYAKWFKEISRDAHSLFTWESSRNMLFFMWIDFMNTEVAELTAKVQAKCKTVLVLITGEVFKNCVKEWRHMVQKTKVIKRRWLQGSKDTAMRKWKKYIADIHGNLDAAADRLRVLCRHLTGDFASSAFHEWKDFLRKKKTAVRRLVHRTLFFGWDRWIEHMEEAAEVIRKVNIKCASVVSLISGDLFHFCYHELHKHAVRKITTRRVTKEYKDKIVNIMWQRWIAQVNEIGKLYQKIRTKCAKVVYYISHGAAVGCFANWKVEILTHNSQ